MAGSDGARVLLVNPNSSMACSAGIDTAVAGFRRAGGPRIEVATVADGPAGIYSWRDWHAAVGPLCRVVAAELADVFVVACASDPGIEAVREVTDRPVLGVFRCAVAAALLRAERFGVIALVDASIGRHGVALRAMGVQERLAAEIAMNTTIEALLDPVATRASLIATGQALVARGAGAVILGCTRHGRASRCGGGGDRGAGDRAMPGGGGSGGGDCRGPCVASRAVIPHGWHVTRAKSWPAAGGRRPGLRRFAVLVPIFGDETVILRSLTKSERAGEMGMANSEFTSPAGNGA